MRATTSPYLSLHLLLHQLLLLLLLLSNDVKGQRRTRARRDHAEVAPGPNMCKVQHVLGTKDKFFTHCVAKHLKMICERPTYTRWECCPGFTRSRNDQGCSVERPLDNIMETAQDLDLKEFTKHAEETGLHKELTKHGPFTIFAPNDEAFGHLSKEEQSMMSPDDESLPLLNYHIAPGRLNISTFRDRDQEFITLHNGDRVRVNKYAYGVATVNCARIVRPDEKATNGVIHVIDKVINPQDIQGSLAQKVMSDGRFSQFQLALVVSDMAKKLKSKSKSFTLLAPTNEAFSKLPNEMLDRILTDADTAEKVINHHIVRGVYCADAIVLAVGLKTLDDTRLLFRCKRDGLWINHAKIVHPDVVASNGVLHGIDTVLLPDSVKATQELLQEMHLDGFLELARQAGLNNTFDMENITVFSPTDRAIAELPARYLAALREEPLKMKRLLNYHIVRGRIADGDLVGDSELDTFADVGVKIKINVLRAGITVDRAILSEHPRECKNAVIHKVDKVLVPPENSLMDVIMDDPELSMFSEMMFKSGLSEVLQPYGSYTLLAPTNYAIRQLDEKQFQNMMADHIRLIKYVERHVILRMVVKCSVPTRGVYTLKSLYGDDTEFAFDSRKQLYVSKHARVLGDDIMTSNGVLYKIDHVLPCSCERAMRTRTGYYITSHSYMRHY